LALLLLLVVVLFIHSIRKGKRIRAQFNETLTRKSDDECPIIKKKKVYAALMMRSENENDFVSQYKIME